MRSSPGEHGCSRSRSRHRGSSASPRRSSSEMSTALPRRLAATLALLVSAAALAPPSDASQDNHQRQVLVVYSTRRDAQVALIGERDIPRILEDGLDRHLDYYAEFVDPARFSDA